MSRTRYTSAGIAWLVARAARSITSNRRGCSAAVSRGPGGAKRSGRGSTDHRMVPALTRQTSATFGCRRPNSTHSTYGTTSKAPAIARAST